MVSLCVKLFERVFVFDKKAQEPSFYSRGFQVLINCFGNAFILISLAGDISEGQGLGIDLVIYRCKNG
jgi:hypothetical protein